MPITRDDQTNILRHLLYNVLNIDKKESAFAIIQCFTDNDIKNIDDFEALEIKDVDGLTYTKTDTTTNASNIVFLPVGHRGNLCHLLRYVKLIAAQYNKSNNAYPPLSH